MRGRVVEEMRERKKKKRAGVNVYEQFWADEGKTHWLSLATLE